MPVGPAGSSGVGGGGTTNKLAKFISDSGVGDSRLSDDGTTIDANSGAGTFQAGDTSFGANGSLIKIDDLAKSISLQSDSNGNGQEIELDGVAESITLFVGGAAGSANMTVGAGNAGAGLGSVNITASAIRPNSGGVTDLGTSAVGFKQAFFDATITAGGTTGDQTINKSAGSVNIAAGQSSIVVTCDKCTTSSFVFPIVATNDATATIKNCTAANGSFTIRLTAAATAETRVNFWVLNQ